MLTQKFSSKHSLLLAGGALCVAVGCQTNPQVQAQQEAPQNVPVLTGEAARGDWTTDAPGVRRLLTPADMDKPYETKSVDNGPKMVPRPEGALPKVPAGFKVTEFAKGLDNPRVIVTAPNGDFFVAESGPGRVRILRDANNDGTPEVNEIFADRFKTAVWHRFLSAGRQSAICLCCQHRFGGAFCL